MNLTVKIITLIIFLMDFVGVILMLLLKPWYAGLCVFISMSIIILIIYLFYSVKYYIVTNDKIILVRPWRKYNKEYAFLNIKNVRTASKEDMKGSVRLNAVGGLFGYYGLFSNNKLGDYTMYANNGNHCIIITLKDKKILVLSPDDITMKDILNERVSKYPE